MIKDIRQMTTRTVVQPDGTRARLRNIVTLEDAQEAWAQWCVEGRCSEEPEKTAPTQGTADVSAYVNASRWVADCPNCNTGMATSPEFQECFCGGCGTIYQVTHPTYGRIERASEVLLVRDPDHVNWFPEREDLNDLKAENARMGLPFAGGD